MLSTVPNLDLRAIHRLHNRTHDRAAVGLTEHFTAREAEFAELLDRYKRVCRRPFPTNSEVLAIVLALGYRPVEEPYPLLPRGRTFANELALATSERRLPRGIPLATERRSGSRRNAARRPATTTRNEA